MKPSKKQKQQWRQLAKTNLWSAIRKNVLRISARNTLNQIGFKKNDLTILN